jgi:hypothetical protein
MNMKKNILKIIIVTTVVLGLFVSCDKDQEFLANYDSTESLAYLKIVHYSPAFRQVVNGRDSFNVYVNGNKVNGAFLTYGSIFPGNTTPYLAVPAGPQSLRITVNGVLTPDSITLASLNKTLEPGGYYSFIITDSVLKSNEAKQMFLRDLVAKTDTAHFSLRFVHALLNDTVGKNVDIYSVRYKTNIFSNIAPGTATPFSVLDYTALTDTLIVRRPGFLYPLDSLRGASFARQRAYTVVYKGLPGTTTGTKARTLTQHTNL